METLREQGAEEFILRRKKSYLAEMPIERIYLALVLIFGTLFLFIQPIFSPPDEGTHFRNAYATFHVSNEENDDFERYVRHTDIYSTRDGTFTQRYFLTQGDFRDNILSNNFSRRSVQYLPQAIGLIVGQLVYPSPGVMILFGRLFQFTFYAAISYLAIKKAKFGQYLLAGTALLPQTLQQVTSLSFDGYFFLVVFCVFSYATNLWTRTKELRIKDWLCMLALSFALYFAKTSALTMLLYFAVMPTAILGKNFFARFAENFWKFWDKYKFLTSLVLVLLAGIVIFIGFREYGGFVLGLQVLINTYGRPDISPHLDPIVTDGMIGNFSWFVFKLPSWLIVLNFMHLALLAFADKKVELERRMPVASLIIYVTNLLVVAIVMYSQWTIASLNNVDISWSEGIQGRYFTPFIVLLSPVAVYLRKYIHLVINEIHLKKIFIVFTSFTLIYSLTLFLLFFYTYDGGRWILPSVWQNIRGFF